jgi:hypothetical protein
MPTETGTTTISDRSLAAYLRAKRHEVGYSPRHNGHLDFEFILTPQLMADIQAFNQNPTIPVLTFLSAQRELTDAIRDHRNRGGRHEI